MNVFVSVGASGLHFLLLLESLQNFARANEAAIGGVTADLPQK